MSRRALARPEEQVGNPLWSSVEELESEVSDWRHPPEELFVVEEEDSRVVGFAGVELAAGFEHADLFGPLVAPGFRGRKIGSALLEAALARARRLGARGVLGSVGAHNLPGRLLLEQAGFHAVGGPEAVFRLNARDHHPLEEAPPGVAVRRGTPRDLDAALSLYRECFPGGAFPTSVWEAGLARGNVYLAEADGRPLAFVDVDPNDRWLYHIGVTESERARGVGGYLLSWALRDYWERHPGEVLGLSVSADNVPALRLYRRQGFAPWLVLQTFELALDEEDASAA